jgi:hypothetical protein
MIGGRRAFLRHTLLAGVWLWSSGHTPYNQWNVYRQKHLLILTSKADPEGYVLGQKIAETLLERLPSSGARVTRAPDLARVASLIATKQLDIAVLRRGDARAMRDGTPPFEAFGAVPLRVVADFGDHVLVSRDDFPAAHAYRVAAALADGGDGAMAPAADGEGPADLPLHDGAAAFRRGAPPPDDAG